MYRGLCAMVMVLSLLPTPARADDAKSEEAACMAADETRSWVRASISCKSAAFEFGLLARQSVGPHHDEMRLHELGNLTLSAKANTMLPSNRDHAEGIAQYQAALQLARDLAHNGSTAGYRSIGERFVKRLSALVHA